MSILSPEDKIKESIKISTEVCKSLMLLFIAIGASLVQYMASVDEWSKTNWGDYIVASFLGILLVIIFLLINFFFQRAFHPLKNK